MAVGVAAAVLSAATAQARSYTYETVDLPDPSSFYHTQDTYLFGINNAGVAVGGARAVLNSNGQYFLDMGVGYNPQSGNAYQFAGGGGYNLSLNNLGFGTLKPNKVYPSSNPSWSFSMTSPILRAPIDYPGAYVTYAADINDSGDVVGYYSAPGQGFHAFLYHNPTYTYANGVYVDIPDVPGSLPNTTRGISIDNAGDMVLRADMPGVGPQTFFYRNGQFIRTDTVTPGRVVQINNVGGLLSSLVDSDGDIFGAYLDGGLTTPIRAPGAQFTYVTGLNDIGQVVGYYYDDATDNFASGFIATLAVPEPASWAMMVAGFGLVGATLRRQRRQVATVA